MSDPLHIISLGAGVQSSTMALMAAHGEITPMPAAAVFADTQAEPASVYKWLDWLERQLPFPVARVTRGSLEQDGLIMRQTTDGRLFPRTDIPVFTRNHDGSIGRVTFRSCTADYKIKPIMKFARWLGQIKRGQKTVGVVCWIGISTDEASRMKPARDPWVKSRWPLIENGISRAGCLEWMKRHGYPTPPRSSCVFCPFHNDTEWRRLKDDEPEEFARAVAFERTFQAAKANPENFHTTPFLHRKALPLDSIDFRSDEQRGQLNFFQNDCEGMCGV
jgi:hypothetical protein